MQLAQGLRNPIIPEEYGSGVVADGGIVAGGFISGMVGFFLVISAVLALIYLLTGAMYWVTSTGDKDKLESARNRIIHSLIGLVVVASAWAVMLLVSNFLGIDFQAIPIPSIVPNQ